MEKTQGKGFHLKTLALESAQQPSNNGVVKIARGTLVMAAVTVNHVESEFQGLFPVTVNRDRSADPTPLGAESAIAPPKDPSLLTLCDKAFTDTMALLSVKSETKICNSVASLPAIILSSITRSLRLCDILVSKWITATTRYKKMRHDVLSYFIPVKSGGTLIVAVMRLDPGDDIPRMALPTLVRSYGGSVLKALGTLSQKIDK